MKLLHTYAAVTATDAENKRQIIKVRLVEF